MKRFLSNHTDTTRPDRHAQITGYAPYRPSTPMGQNGTSACGTWHIPITVRQRSLTCWAKVIGSTGESRGNPGAQPPSLRLNMPDG